MREYIKEILGWDLDLSNTSLTPGCVLTALISRQFYVVEIKAVLRSHAEPLPWTGHLLAGWRQAGLALNRLVSACLMQKRGEIQVFARQQRGESASSRERRGRGAGGQEGPERFRRETLGPLPRSQPGHKHSPTLPPPRSPWLSPLLTGGCEALLKKC